MIDIDQQSNVNFNGIWKNQLGSQMQLVITNNKIKGVYRTKVGAPQPTEEFELVGFTSGDLISFTVNFGKYGSLTAWVGQHTQNQAGEDEIKTLWHLAKNIKDEDEPTDLWKSVLAGANNFTRVHS